jgi:hypothetical protein
MESELSFVMSDKSSLGQSPNQRQHTRRQSLRRRRRTFLPSPHSQPPSLTSNKSEGDLWYFPAGYPHSLQATTEPDGAEFILVFDSGTFSEESTFQLTDWMTHVPKEALAKNFGVPEGEFDRVPEEELFIFPGAIVPSPAIEGLTDVRSGCTACGSEVGHGRAERYASTVHVRAVKGQGESD